MIAPGKDAGIKIDRLPELGRVHPLIVGAEQHERRRFPHRLAHSGVVRLLARLTREGEGARDAHLLLEEAAKPACIGLGRDNREGGRGEEVLRHAPPQVPDRLDRRVLLPGDEGFGIDADERAELRRKLVVANSPIGARSHGRSSVSHRRAPNSRYMQMLTSASGSRAMSSMWLPSGNTMLISQPMPSTRRRISARSDGMLNVP
jgi:hypothetical protein